MTSDDSKDPPAPPGTGITSVIGFRMRDLLLAALESPAEDGTRPDGAAGASQMLGALGRRIGAPGEGLLEEAMAPTALVPDLVRIKEAAKVLMTRAERRDDREAAVLLYSVAVASALVRYGAEISSAPADDQRERYDALATRHAGFALGDLFRRAADRLRMHVSPR
jgi:hypothetical protein